MFSVRTVLGDKTSEVEQVPSFLKVAHQHPDKNRTSKRMHHVWLV